MIRLTTHKSFVRNGDLGAWSGGVPTNFDIDQTNTTVVQLLREQQIEHLMGLTRFVVDETLGFAPNIPIRANPLVASGSSALRFRGDSSLTAGDFAIRTPGIGAAHTGTPTGQRLPVEASKHSYFSFTTRGTPGNVFAINLILQTGGTPQYLQPTAPQPAQPQIGDDAWTTTANALTFVASAEWRTQSIEFMPLSFNSAIMDDQLMFEITNITTGVFILDLDSIEYRLDDPLADQGSV